MITIKIHDKDFEICEGWDEVSMGQIFDLDTLKKSDWDQFTLGLKILACMSNDPVTFEDYVNEFIPYTELPEFMTMMNEQLKWLEIDFNESSQKTEPKFETEIDGRRIGIKKDINMISTGEYVYIQNFMKDGKFTPFEAAFGVLIRELDENGKQKKFNPEFFEELMTTLKYKIRALDFHQHLVFFSNGTTKSETKPSKSFSIQNKSVNKE